MKKTLFFISVIGIPGAFAFALLQPESALRQTGVRATVLDGAPADAHVLSIFERSCENCHSANTEWPLYSRIFPLSKLIERDVRTARARINLSGWEIYSDDEKGRILSEIGSVVRNRIMPPRRYTLLHPSAKLSAADANEIYRWTRTARRLLRAPGINQPFR